MEDRVGQQLGNYQLQRLLGQGSFADVYLGEHIHLHTQAAIKILQVRLVESNIQSFLNEARTIAHLVHPFIIRVLDFGVQEKIPFLVMDYAPGGTFRQHFLKGSPLPPASLVPYIKQTAAALQHAHEGRLIHRDVKPENMLLGSHDEVLLSDFGLAMMTTHNSSARASADMAGTAAYMAPEQLQGRPCPASDQYSLAVIVYEWLTGNCPYLGSFFEIGSQHMMAPVPSVRTKIPTITAELDKVVMKALAKDPHQRFASIREFGATLEEVCLHSRLFTFERSSLSSARNASDDLLNILSPGTTALSLPYPVGDSVKESPGKRAQSEISRLEPRKPSPPGETRSAGGPAFRSMNGLPSMRQSFQEGKMNALTSSSIGQQQPPPAFQSFSRPLYLESIMQTVQQPNRLQSVQHQRLQPIRLQSVQHQRSQPIRLQSVQHQRSQEDFSFISQIQQPQMQFSLLNEAAVETPPEGRADNGQSLPTAAPPLVGLPILPDPPRRNSTTGKFILFLVLAIMIGSSTLFYIAGTNLNRNNSASHPIITRTAVVHHAPIPQAATTPPKAGDPNANPYPPHRGTVVVSEPLSSNRIGWRVYGNAAAGNACQFLDDSYHIVMTANSSGACMAASTDYSNFTYQVQMKFVKVGHQFSGGGIIFRGNETANTFYFLELFESGRYTLALCNKFKCTPHDLAGYPKQLQAIPSFHQGLNQSNTIAVVVNNYTISIYVNGQQVGGPITDATYTYGMIGVYATGGTEKGGDATADIAFTNAVVWLL